jgi:hypothetical protein
VAGGGPRQWAVEHIGGCSGAVWELTKGGRPRMGGNFGKGEILGWERLSKRGGGPGLKKFRGLGGGGWGGMGWGGGVFQARIKQIAALK